MLTGNLEMQLWLGLLQHTFSLSDGISLQLEQMHQLGAVTVLSWGSGFSPWIVWRMSNINEGCLEHTNLKASLRPLVSSDEMQFWNWIHIHLKKKYKIEIKKKLVPLFTIFVYCCQYLHMSVSFLSCSCCQFHTVRSLVSSSSSTPPSPGATATSTPRCGSLLRKRNIFFIGLWKLISNWNW